MRAPPRCATRCVPARADQLVATASRDKSVKLWALHRTQPQEEADGTPAPLSEARTAGAATSGGAWSTACCAELAHRSQVWRVAWNASGSMLATSEDDGTVRVFKMDQHGGWSNAEPLSLRTA